MTIAILPDTIVSKYILRPQGNTEEPIEVSLENPKVEIGSGFVEITGTESPSLRFVSPRCFGGVTVNNQLVGNKTLEPGNTLRFPNGKTYTVEAA